MIFSSLYISKMRCTSKKMINDCWISRVGIFFSLSLLSLERFFFAPREECKVCWRTNDDTILSSVYVLKNYKNVKFCRVWVSDRTLKSEISIVEHFLCHFSRKILRNCLNDFSSLQGKFSIIFRIISNARIVLKTISWVSEMTIEISHKHSWTCVWCYF